MPIPRARRPNVLPEGYYSTHPSRHQNINARTRATDQNRERNAFLLEQEQGQAGREAKRRELMAGSATPEKYRSGLRGEGDIEGLENAFTAAEAERKFTEELKTDRYKAAYLSLMTGKPDEAAATLGLAPGSLSVKKGVIVYNNPDTKQKENWSAAWLAEIMGITPGRGRTGQTQAERIEMEQVKAGLRKPSTGTTPAERKKTSLQKRVADREKQIQKDQEADYKRKPGKEGWLDAAARNKEALRQIKEEDSPPPPPPSPDPQYEAGPRPSPVNALATPAGGPAAAPPPQGSGGWLGNMFKGYYGPGAGPQTPTSAPAAPRVAAPARPQAPPSAPRPQAPRAAPAAPARAAAQARGATTQGPQVGKIYRDPKGVRAKYLGGDPNDKSSWEIQ